MSLLDSAFGVRAFFVNAVAQIFRNRLNFKDNARGAWTFTDEVDADGRPWSTVEFTPTLQPGEGDVAGPAGSVDDRIATFDGPSGKIIQDGGTTIATLVAATAAALAAADEADDTADAAQATANTGVSNAATALAAANAANAAIAAYSALATTLTGASNTLSIGHDGQAVPVDHTALSTLTVPPNSTAAFRVGTLMSLHQVGVGQILVAAGAGVTLVYSETLKSKRQGATVWLRKTATNTWYVWGDLEGRGLQYHVATAQTKGLWQLAGSLVDTGGLSHNFSVDSGTIEYADVLPGKKFAWFDGATRLIAAHADLQILGALTIQVLMVLDAGPTGQIWLSHLAAGETEVANAIYQSSIASGRLLAWFSEHGAGTNDTFSWAAPDSLPPVHQLFHLTQTRSSGGTIQNYCNGRTLGASQALTSPTGGSTGSLRLGGTDAAFMTNFFAASLRINAEERTAAQVAADYSYCLGGIYGDYVP